MKIKGSADAEQYVAHQHENDSSWVMNDVIHNGQGGKKETIPPAPGDPRGTNKTPDWLPSNPNDPGTTGTARECVWTHDLTTDYFKKRANGHKYWQLKAMAEWAAKDRRSAELYIPSNMSDSEIADDIRNMSGLNIIRDLPEIKKDGSYESVGEVDDWTHP